MQFVVRELTEGPADLGAQLPVAVDALSTLTDDNGGQYWCVQLDQPVMYRISPGTTPPVNADPQYLAEDGEGLFLWVYVLVLTIRGGLQPHSGHDSAAVAQPARTVSIDVGYVVDLSLADDAALDADKVRWTAVAVADVTEPQVAGNNMPEADTVAGGGSLPAPQLDAAAAAPAHTQHGLADFVNEHIAAAIDQLARLAGTNFSSDIPRAVQITEHQTPPDNKPAYLIDGTTLRYHTVHPTQGWYWKITEDPEELVYWVMDDIVRSLARRWAQDAPAAKAMSPSQVEAALWIPYWLTLLAALNPQWRANTARLIDS